MRELDHILLAIVLFEELAGDACIHCSAITYIVAS